MPHLDHVGDYSGDRLSLPPGALVPKTVVKAVVRLADHARGRRAGDRAQARPVRRSKFGAALMNGFTGVWSKAAKGEDMHGTLFDSPAQARGPGRNRRHPDRRRTAAAAAGIAGAPGVVAIGGWLWRRR